MGVGRRVLHLTPGVANALKHPTQQTPTPPGHRFCLVRRFGIEIEPSGSNRHEINGFVPQSLWLLDLLNRAWNRALQRWLPRFGPRADDGARGPGDGTGHLLLEHGPDVREEGLEVRVVV